MSIYDSTVNPADKLKDVCLEYRLQLKKNYSKQRIDKYVGYMAQALGTTIGLELTDDVLLITVSLGDLEKADAIEEQYCLPVREATELVLTNLSTLYRHLVMMQAAPLALSIRVYKDG